MNLIAINKAHFPVHTLGFGKRVGLWLQGCSIQCPGCINRDTWEFDPATQIALPDLIRALAPWLQAADGVTVSGGEPFDQPLALEALLELLHQVHAGDILVFSGYSLEHLQANFQGILARIDVLVSDPFDQSTGQTLALRGSDNQRITLLSDLARERYPAAINTLTKGSLSLDLQIGDGGARLAGIPSPGFARDLRRRLREKGFSATTSDQPPS